MAQCGGCGAPVIHGEREDTGDVVPLEPRAELGPGDGRYIILGRKPNGGHHVVRPVSRTSPVEAYADHRLDCPDYGNGHT